MRHMRSGGAARFGVEISDYRGMGSLARSPAHRIRERIINFTGNKALTYLAAAEQISAHCLEELRCFIALHANLRVFGKKY